MMLRKTRLGLTDFYFFLQQSLREINFGAKPESDGERKIRSGTFY